MCYTYTFIIFSAVKWSNINDCILIVTKGVWAYRHKLLQRIHFDNLLAPSWGTQLEACHVKMSQMTLIKNTYEPASIRSKACNSKMARLTLIKTYEFPLQDLKPIATIHIRRWRFFSDGKEFADRLFLSVKGS